MFILNRNIYTGAFSNLNNEKHFFGITFACDSIQKDFRLSNATMEECSAVFVSVLSISFLLRNYAVEKGRDISVDYECNTIFHFKHDG